MQITVDKRKYPQRVFAEVYLKKFMTSMFISAYDKDRLTLISDYHNIDFLYAILLAIKSMQFAETGSSYILSLDPVKKYRHRPLKNIIELLTYGNREVRGYPILLDIITYMNNNLDILYSRWRDGN